MSPRRSPIDEVVNEAIESVEPARLRELARHKSARVRMAVADNLAADDDVLLELAHDRHDVVPLVAARNQRRRPDLERVLATSANPNVRQVLSHKYKHSPLFLPWDVQRILACDSDREVRGRTAETTNFRDVFELCMADPHIYVRSMCSQNPRAGEADLERLIADKRAEVRASVAGGWFARPGNSPSDEQLVRLAQDRSVLVRSSVALRARAPEEVWDILVADLDESIRDQAVQNRRGRVSLREDPGVPEDVAARIESGDDESLRYRMMFEGDPFDDPPANGIEPKT